MLTFSSRGSSCNIRINRPSVSTRIRVLAASLPLKTDLIADLAPEGCPAFIGHPPRGGTSGETARLQHENLSLASQSGVQQRRWDAGRLAGPGRGPQDGTVAIA